MPEVPLQLQLARATAPMTDVGRQAAVRLAAETTAQHAAAQLTIE